MTYKMHKHVDVGYAEAQRQREIEAQAMQVVRGEGYATLKPRPPRGTEFVVPPTVLHDKHGHRQIVGFIKTKVRGKDYSKRAKDGKE